MTTFGRIPVDGIEPVSFPQGIPIVGATLTIYITGGTTLASIFTTSAGSVPMANPQTSDSAGRFYSQSTSIWADASQAYDLVVAYPAGGSTTYVGQYTIAAQPNLSGFLTNPNVNLTGVPTATTASLGTATSQLATTQFVQNAINAISVFPTGMCALFGMTALPSGWLVCDGSAVSRTTYAALFAQIGTTYGVGNGTTTFNVPTAQGQFIRVYNATGSGTDSGHALGVIQADQLQGHIHYGGQAQNNGAASIYSVVTTDIPGIATGVAAQNAGGVTDQQTTSVPKTDGTNGTPRTGSETRPTNLNFVLAIKT
jgi:microcystin-dependent protein